MVPTYFNCEGNCITYDVLYPMTAWLVTICSFMEREYARSSTIEGYVCPRNLPFMAIVIKLHIVV